MKTHAACSGCSLCLLACPVWRQTRDIRLTPHGRAKAMQHGASSAQLADSIASCTLCGACEPACPEAIPLVDMMLELRRQQPLPHAAEFLSGEDPGGDVVLLAGAALRADTGRLVRVASLLDAVIAADDGSDIARAIEAGAPVLPHRLAAFLKNMNKARSLIVADGLLLRKLREWLPKVRAASLGEALSAHETVRANLRATDLYVIEPRAFHGDHARLVRHYDTLRVRLKLQTNMDLHRLAIPTGASSAARRIDALSQARWILQDRVFERVVVEDAGDCAVFSAVTDRPVVHVGDL